MEKGKINNLFDYQIDKNILSYQTNKYKVGYLCIYLENAMDLFWFSNLLDNKKALKTFLICDLKKFSFWCFIKIKKQKFPEFCKTHKSLVNLLHSKIEKSKHPFSFVKNSRLEQNFFFFFPHYRKNLKNHEFALKPRIEEKFLSLIDLDNSSKIYYGQIQFKICISNLQNLKILLEFIKTLSVKIYAIFTQNQFFRKKHDFVCLICTESPEDFIKIRDFLRINRFGEEFSIEMLKIKNFRKILKKEPLKTHYKIKKYEIQNFTKIIVQKKKSEKQSFRKLIKRKKNSFRNIVIKKFQENKKIKLKNLKENIFYLENFPKTYLLIFSKIKLNQIYSFFKQQYDKSQIIILIFPKKRHCSLLFQKTKLDQLNNVYIFNWNQKKKIIKFLKKSLIKSRNETFSNLSSKFL